LQATIRDQDTLRRLQDEIASARRELDALKRERALVAQSPERSTEANGARNRADKGQRTVIEKSKTVTEKAKNKTKAKEADSRKSAETEHKATGQASSEHAEEDLKAYHERKAKEEFMKLFQAHMDGTDEPVPLLPDRDYEEEDRLEALRWGKTRSKGDGLQGPEVEASDSGAEFLVGAAESDVGRVSANTLESDNNSTPSTHQLANGPAESKKEAEKNSQLPTNAVSSEAVRKRSDTAPKISVKNRGSAPRSNKTVATESAATEQADELAASSDQETDTKLEEADRNFEQIVETVRSVRAQAASLPDSVRRQRAADAIMSLLSSLGKDELPGDIDRIESEFGVEPETDNDR